MAQSHPASSESESQSNDEAAPEIISLAQSKKDIKKLDAELKKAEVAERQSRRRQNREVDRKLKERADMNRSGKNKKKGGDDEVDDLEVRMQRAMQEAQEEMDEENEGGSGSESGSRSGSGCGGRDSNSENSDEDEDEDEQDSVHPEGAETLLPPTKPKKSKSYNPDHLPDELFKAAFASQTAASKRKATEDEDDKLVKQRLKKPKRSHTQQKDLVVGSKTIRMLPTPGQPITPSAAPSDKVNKFLNRSLALEGGKQRWKTWERRPANIGVLRRDGPASNFVRNR